MHTVYLGLGSNLGDRRAIIINTIKHINNKIGKVIKKILFNRNCAMGI